VTAALNHSLATVRVGGREYPATGSQRCATCVHPERADIEGFLVRGWSPESISKSLPADLALTGRQIGDHYRHHVPVHQEGVAKYREAAAEARGLMVAVGAEQVVTALTFAQRVMTTVDARVATGDLIPTIADGLRAAQVLAAVAEVDGGGPSDEETTIAFMVYLKAIRQTCTKSQVKEIGRIISSDPVMQRMWSGRDHHDEEYEP
jgi:hypothetical protein